MKRLLVSVLLAMLLPAGEHAAQLGKAAATIIHRHQGGQKLEDMPVQADRDPDLKINGATARLLGSTIPEPVRKRAIVAE